MGVKRCLEEDDEHLVNEFLEDDLLLEWVGWHLWTVDLGGFDDGAGGWGALLWSRWDCESAAKDGQEWDKILELHFE